MLSPWLRITATNLAALASAGTRVAVIGPSGWLGMAAIAMLDRALAAEDLRRTLLIFGSHARPIVSPSSVHLDCFALETLADHDLGDCVILHFGYLTNDKTALMSVDDYVSANDAIQGHVLRAIRGSAPRALFFASSGAVYQGSDAGTPAKADNLYGWMKAKHEAELREATERAGVSFVNGRIFTLAGEFINKTELYALSSFLCDLQTDQPIRLYSNCPVLRSYVYVGDAINLALALMLNRRDSLSFDMAGCDVVEIGQLASMCAAIVGKPDAAISRPTFAADSKPNRMIGDYAPFYRLMEREGIDALGLNMQIAATATYLGFEGLSCQ